MKKTRTRFLVPVFLGMSFILSCSQNGNTEKEKSRKKNERQTALNNFVKKFKVIPLPVQFRNHEGISLEGLQKVNEKEAEYFLRGEGNYYCYGMLEDTTDHYSLILLYPADVVVPQLHTFSREGKIIDQQELILSGCYMDCGWKKCTSDCLIDAQRNITLVDTSDFFMCDEKGEEILTSREYFVQKIVIRMNESGNFIQGNYGKTDLKEK